MLNGSLAKMLVKCVVRVPFGGAGVSIGRTFTTVCDLIL
jgi:hypothetical protein